MKRIVLAMLRTSILATLVLVFVVPGLALAQSTPAPSSSSGPSTLTVVVTVLSLAVGFINQSVNQGSLLGVVTTPKAWLPYLTLAATFLGGTIASLSQAAALNGGSIWGAIVAGLSALLAGAGGIAIAHHVSLKKVSQPAQPAPASDVKPASDAKSAT